MSMLSDILWEPCVPCVSSLLLWLIGQRHGRFLVHTHGAPGATDLRHEGSTVESTCLPVVSSETNIAIAVELCDLLSRCV